MDLLTSKPLETHFLFIADTPKIKKAESFSKRPGLKKFLVSDKQDKLTFYHFPVLAIFAAGIDLRSASARSISA
jgi:hypothetical protein